MLLLFKAGVLVLVLLIPFVFVHEMGHAVYCAYEGYEYTIGFNAMGGYTICHGDIEDMWSYAFIGGLLAAITAGSISWFVWQWKPLWVALTTIATLQSINAIIETEFYEQYMSNDSFIPSMFGFLLFIILIIFTMVAKRSMKNEIYES